SLGVAATSGPSRNCSAMPACRPRRSIPGSIRRGCLRSTKAPTRGREPSATLRGRGLTVSPLFDPRKTPMKKAAALADSVSLPALKLLALLNVLFFLSFLAVLLLAAGKARAETPVCAGADMTAALQKDDPAAYGKILAEAAATPNGKGLLWKLEKSGERPSYLFGTMHMTDPRVVALPAAARKAFDAADTVVIETTEVLDQKKMMATLASEPGLMMFTDDTTLASLLSPADRT